MKTSKLLAMLFSFLMVTVFSSCSDDESGMVNSLQLKGIWFVTEPVLADDYVTSYTFETDKICSIYTGSPVSNGVPLQRTYKITKGGSIITFFDEDGNRTEQYQILKQTFDKMEWRNITPKDGNSDKCLEKAKSQ
ncbi:hypothetical protein AAE250_19480 [Bacteroides sp. GD17]|jgi:hypothetical protein|uniref:hypothetical protein n=1 Tax=Bacteroides sp. GD17 TaxID=3139826 RepID=UPI0025F025CB|nr:hypothetical protein [uncultured Bacteroides sp.]